MIEFITELNIWILLIGFLIAFVIDYIYQGSKNLDKHDGK